VAGSVRIRIDVVLAGVISVHLSVSGYFDGHRPLRLRIHPARGILSCVFSICYSVSTMAGSIFGSSSFRILAGFGVHH